MENIKHLHTLKWLSQRSGMSVSVLHKYIRNNKLVAYKLDNTLFLVSDEELPKFLIDKINEQEKINQ